MGCFEGEWRLNQRYAYIRNLGYFGMIVWKFFAARAFNIYSYWHSSTYLLSILKITPNEGIVTNVKIMLPLPPPKFYELLCHRKKKKRRSTKWGAKITFRHDILIPFIQFGQNLAWTYYLTLQPKQVYVRISHSSQNTRWPTNPISARHLDLVHQITTKLNMDILLDPTNNFAQEFII